MFILVTGGLAICSLCNRSILIQSCRGEMWYVILSIRDPHIEILDLEPQLLICDPHIILICLCDRQKMAFDQSADFSDEGKKVSPILPIPPKMDEIQAHHNRRDYSGFLFD